MIDLFADEAAPVTQAAPRPPVVAGEVRSGGQSPCRAPQAEASAHGGATYVLDNGNGQALRVWAADVPPTVWDEPGVWSHFVGGKVPGFEDFGRDQCDSFQGFLVEVGKDAVTDGQHWYTLARGGVVFCHPMRLAAAQKGPEALADQIASEVGGLVARFDEEAAKAQVRARDIERAHASAGRFAADHLARFIPRVDHEQLCTSLLDGLMEQRGRAMLGLDPQVTIDAGAVRAYALADFHAAEERRRMRESRRWAARRRGEEVEDDDGAPSEQVSTVNWRDVCRLLVNRYSGEAARELRYAEQAGILMRRLCLERSKFEVKNGRVELEPWFRCYDYTHDKGPTHDTKTEFAEIFRGLAAVYRERGAEPPVALEHFRVDQLDRNSSYELGPDLKLRTHVGCAKLILSESLANSLREFIASHKEASAC